MDSFDRLRALEKKRFDTEHKGRIPVMDAETLRELCLENEGYETPELNDSLYAHFRGFQKIEGLAPYYNLKALWLESNGLSCIEGLSPLVNLRCLYLSKNIISTIENLECLRDLNTLDLSENRITTISGLAILPNLSSLNLSRNQLSSASDLLELVACNQLSNLDISHNRIDDDQENEGRANVLEVLTQVPQLKALRITGNPVVSRTKHFRKAFIAAMPQLAFLDRPIFPIERAGVAAWKDGGNEAELKAKREFVEKENDERKRTLHEFREWQAQIREKRIAEIELERAKKQEEANAQGEGEDPVTHCDVDLRGFRGITKDEYVKMDAAERAKWDERINQAHIDSAKDRGEVLGDGISKLGTKFWAESAPVSMPGQLSETPCEITATTEVPTSVAASIHQADETESLVTPVNTPDNATTTTVPVATPATTEALYAAGETSPISKVTASLQYKDTTASSSASQEDRSHQVDGASEASEGPSMRRCKAGEQREAELLASIDDEDHHEEISSNPVEVSSLHVLSPPPAPTRVTHRLDERPTADLAGFPTGLEPRETWAELQRRASAAASAVRPSSLPSAFLVRIFSTVSKGFETWLVMALTEGCNGFTD